MSRRALDARFLSQNAACRIVMHVARSGPSLSLSCGVPRREERRALARGKGPRLTKPMNLSRLRWAARRGLPRTASDLLHMAPRDRDRSFATQLLSGDAAFWAARDVAAQCRREELPVMFSATIGKS